jgi:hypothetical protein
MKITTISEYAVHCEECGEYETCNDLDAVAETPTQTFKRLGWTGNRCILRT